MNNFKFDTHMHLDLFDEMEAIIKYIEKEKSYTIVMTNLPVLYSKYMNKYRNLNYIRFGLGFHPELVYEYESQIDIFLDNLKYAKYIGEIGLDYKVKDEDNIKKQKRVFKKIIDACKREGGKVLSIHSRSAASDINNIIGKFNGTVIMHWFTGSKVELIQSISNGYYFSINEKMINSERKKILLKSIPVDKILIESDAPFTRKNKIYELDFIDNITNELANVYNLDNEAIIDQLKKNFREAISV